MKCGVSSLEYKCDLWGVECRMRSVKCRVSSANSVESKV